MSEAEEVSRAKPEVLLQLNIMQVIKRVSGSEGYRAKMTRQDAVFHRNECKIDNCGAFNHVLEQERTMMYNENDT